MSIVDSLFTRLGYTRFSTAPTVVKASDPERIAQDPLAMAYATMNLESGLRRSSGITMQTLKRMAHSNWVDRTCIFTLRDEITAIPFDIVPIDPHKPFNADFQYFLIQLLKHPDRYKGTWRKLIDKVVEDILVYDSGVVEKVRNGRGQVVELYHVDGSTVKSLYDQHGLPGDPAYQQFLTTKNGVYSDKPVAEWDNNDLIYMMWNPQPAVDSYGFGFSPVEAGLSVGTAFLQAEAYNLQFFSSNSIPPVVIQMGKDVPSGEVDKFRSFLAYEMLGQDGFHKPIVGSFGDGFDIKELMKAPTEMGFKDYVEWQMRWKVALYRMSPQDIGFSLDQYKVEGQVQQELSKSKAIDSLKGVLSEYINNEIVGDRGYGPLADNLEFQWIDAESVDPQKQAIIDEIYLKNGVNSINEIRRRNGEDPIAGGAKPTIYLGSQLVSLDATPIGEDGDEEENGDIQKSNIDLARFDYQSTQLDFPEEISRRVKALGSAIPDAELFIDPEYPVYGREHDIHVTVLYGLSKVVTAEEIAQAVADSGPVEVTLGKTSIFEGDECDVLKIEVNGQAIRDLHAKLSTNLDAPGNSFPVYKPHVTIAYLNKGEGAKYAGDTSLEGQTVAFSQLKFCDENGQKTIIVLGRDTLLNEASLVSKSYEANEGRIVSLASNPTAIAWMDDRGVTQPLFVTNFGKTLGVTIKPDFLDDRKGQEPPEAEVADRLRAMQVNTPEVKIMSYDEVLKLLPHELYPAFTNWIDVKAPFDSKEWRDRWGGTRKAQTYIVTGFIDAVDLGNTELQQRMAASPESYLPAVEDWAKVWLAEWQLKLGDRKPGHYLLTSSGHGFGVDYQFYQDSASWTKSNHWLPTTLKQIDPVLFEAFCVFVKRDATSFGTLAKSLPQPADWEKESTLVAIEQKLGQLFQAKLTAYYRKIVHVRRPNRPFVQKTNEFDPGQDYLIGGDGVYQNGVKYPLSVLDAAKQLAATDLAPSLVDYRAAFDFGQQQAFLTLTTKFSDISVHAPELLEKPLQDRINYLSGELSDTLKQLVDQKIVAGIDGGKSYGEIADDIRSALAVDPAAPDFPQWRAERIARTESMWATNEGMRQQYQAVGIKMVNVDAAFSACPTCQSIAGGNPYTLAEAEGLLPIHPNCRCVLTGDWSELAKALPNVLNDPSDTAFVDGNQIKHPVKGEPAFVSFGELIDSATKELLGYLFADVAVSCQTNPKRKYPSLTFVVSYEDLKLAISTVTQAQEERPNAAFTVCVATDEFKRSAYLVFRWDGQEAQ